MPPKKRKQMQFQDRKKANKRRKIRKSFGNFQQKGERKELPIKEGKQETSSGNLFFLHSHTYLRS